jgi:ribosomal protein S18 acetylase RimI-like enzyme
MTQMTPIKPSSPQVLRTRAAAQISPLRPGDLAAVVRLDAKLTGRRKPAYWKSAFRDFVTTKRSRVRVGLAARDGARLVGYLLGDVRAFEFGSAPCGWIFALGVDRAHAHHGIGSALVAEAARRLARTGVPAVRTMVARNDVAMLAFFRSNGFVGGSFTELELDLTPAHARRTPGES